MRSHELFVTDREGHEEKLSKLEAIEEMEELNLEEVAVSACAALEKFKSSKSVEGLAEVHSLMVAEVWNECRTSANVAEKTSAILGRLRVLMQSEWKRGQYHFSNEDIFDQFGKKQESGIITDVLFIIEKQGGDEPGVTVDIYSSPETDSVYSIDHVVTTRDAAEDASHLRQIDLVQVKTSQNRITDGERDRIVKKHKDFLKERRIAIEEFKSMVVSEQELANFAAVMGGEKALSFEDQWFEALTGSNEDAEKTFAESLESFKKSAMDNKDFKSASRALKRAYIESLNIGESNESGGEMGDRLKETFTGWKDSWLSEIKDKKQRVLEPIHAVTVRSVIHYRGGEEEVEVIGKLD